MIKKYIDRLFGRRDRVTHKDARPVIYGKDKHAIEREHISRCARRTCEELQRAGFLAFVVGGAVRDLLLGIRPKDFDAATNATPDEVRSVFRRSRIIGRRFRIVHVLCGADTVEVFGVRSAPIGLGLRVDPGGLNRPDRVGDIVGSETAGQDRRHPNRLNDPAADTPVVGHAERPDLAVVCSMAVQE